MVNTLWKNAKTVENGMGVCSGCAGNYEDPDRSAWEEEAEEEAAEDEDPRSEM
jgi:hypothetical protein